MDQHREELRFIEVGGSKIGPRRFFVRLARHLQRRGVCALRFDQYGSGDPAGDSFDSSFDKWIATTEALVRNYHKAGYRAALLGQTMGGATVRAAAGDLGDLVTSVVAWVPDPSVDAMPPTGEWTEEEGQRV